MTTDLVRLTGRLDGDDRSWAGGKAVGLAALSRLGLAVPDTWVVPVDAAPAADAFAGLAGVAPRWAVRSSATSEDGDRRSYAGMFRSELDVPAADLPAAVARVRASAHGERVAAYRAKVGDGGALGMAVLLQPYRPPARGGVWLGRGPGAGRLEWTRGSGEALVSGVVTPDWEEWTTAGRVGGSAARPLAGGGLPVGEACLAVQDALGVPADLEFALVDDGLLWLQFRPTTADLAAPPAGPLGRDVVRGTAAAPGTASGRGLLLRDAADPGWSADAVLLADHTDPDWVPLMAEASALVTATGGMLCHAAIVARELGVPCVTGVGRAALGALAGGDLVVDGSAGTVAVSR
ncbi:PEP/pyruvate-binding domain-containing protein [Saccharothrix sp. NPDC042600]|uniref:PEP/pyruvate-binding domain-containing protein n=1 Tax=Saccharothrix TaxID=2071 RepID=UPI0033FA088F|nr:hypothetical protein GCM10017745_58260 [Saccharothrix mutabilis subsp. capreolus]